MSKRTSFVWNHYKEIDTNYAECNICQLKISYRSMSNLKKHLQRRHPAIHMKFARRNTAPPVREIIPNSSKSQPTTSAFNGSGLSTVPCTCTLPAKTLVAKPADESDSAAPLDLLVAKVERVGIEVDPISGNNEATDNLESFHVMETLSPAPNEQFISEVTMDENNSSNSSDTDMPNTSRRTDYDEDSLKRKTMEKLDLEIENIKLQNYKTRLEIAKLENELQVSRSKFTKSLF